jgi:hypothetical protein
MATTDNLFMLVVLVVTDSNVPAAKG